MDAETLASLALSYFAAGLHNKPDSKWFEHLGDELIAQELVRLFQMNSLGITMATARYYAKEALKTDTEADEIALTDSIIVPCVIHAITLYVLRPATPDGINMVEIFHRDTNKQADMYFFNNLDDADFCARILIYLEQAKAHINRKPY